jgi:predicted transcriptional regulator
MKRMHEYKVLVLDSKGKISNVLTQDEILNHVAEHGTV